MPWHPSDAERHTKKATTPKSKRAFAAAANSVLERTGDEGRAVRAGNAAAARTRGYASGGRVTSAGERRAGITRLPTEDE